LVSGAAFLATSVVLHAQTLPINERGLLPGDLAMAMATRTHGTRVSETGAVLTRSTR
jgi:hypothetical protein